MPTLSRRYCNTNKYNSYPFPKPAFSVFHKCAYIWCRLDFFLPDTGSCFFYPSLDSVKKWYLAGKSSILFSFSFGDLCSSSPFNLGLLNEGNTDFYYYPRHAGRWPCSGQVEFNSLSLCRGGTHPTAEAAWAEDSPVHPSWPPRQRSSQHSHRPPLHCPGAQLPKGFADS